MNKSLLLVIIAVAMLSGCGDDSTGPDSGGTPPPKFENLSQRTHVLNNFQLAYNRRNITEYNRLLDANFTFFFSASDVAGGLPASWGRADELTMLSRMFDPNYSGGPRCRSIDMDILFEAGVTWTEVSPPGSPGETWYATTVLYEFNMDTEPATSWLSTPGAKARFVLRNAGSGDAPAWRIVELHDMGSVKQMLAGPADVGQVTLGSTKALFR